MATLNVKLKDCTPGDEVLGNDGLFHPVKAVYRHKPDPGKNYYELQLADGGSLKARGDHLFLIDSVELQAGYAFFREVIKLQWSLISEDEQVVELLSTCWSVPAFKSIWVKALLDKGYFFTADTYACVNRLLYSATPEYELSNNGGVLFDTMKFITLLKDGLLPKFCFLAVDDFAEQTGIILKEAQEYEQLLPAHS